jgi:protein pelota
LRILHKDLRYGEIKVYVNTMDDLWYLKNVIRYGESVKMLSFRSKGETSDKLREKKSEKVPMMITISVESIEFHPFSNYLRLRGRITDASEAIGEYHTLTVQPGTELTIIKETWSESELTLLREAEESSKRAKLLIVSIDDEEATLAVVRSYGIEKLAAISSNRSGKQYAEKSNWQREFFGSVAAEVQRRMEESTKLAIVGPGFIKDSFVEFLKDEFHRERVIVESTSDEGMNGVKEAIKKGVLKRAESELRVAEEYELVDELLNMLRKDSAFSALGDEVKKALEAGAAEKLLVLDEKLYDSTELIELARKTGCRVYIISSEHEAGVTLRSFGGVAALLRFKF